MTYRELLSELLVVALLSEDDNCGYLLPKLIVVFVSASGVTVSGWFMQEKPGACAGPRGRRECKRITGWFLTVCALAWGCVAQPCFAADSRPAKNVLILYSFSKRDVFDPQLLESSLRSRVSGPVNFYV